MLLALLRLLLRGMLLSGLRSALALRGNIRVRRALRRAHRPLGRASGRHIPRAGLLSLLRRHPLLHHRVLLLRRHARGVHGEALHASSADHEIRIELLRPAGVRRVHERALLEAWHLEKIVSKRLPKERGRSRVRLEGKVPRGPLGSSRPEEESVGMLCDACDMLPLAFARANLFPRPSFPPPLCYGPCTCQHKGCEAKRFGDVARGVR